MPTVGPQAGPVKVYFTGLQPMIAEALKLQKGLEDVDMTPLVRGAGKVWQENFKAEGWLASQGWKRLSAYTQGMRTERGYSPEHPILQQSGGLRKAAADYPATMAKGQKTMNRTTPATPGGDSSPTTVTVRNNKNRSELKITGSKVANNFGGAGTLRDHEYRLPRRRFWFVSPEVKSQMAEGLSESIKELTNWL